MIKSLASRLASAARCLHRYAKTAKGLLAVLFFFTLAPVVTLLSPPDQRTYIFVSTECAVIVVALGWFTYRQLTPRLGRLTATAAVAILFGITAGVLSALSPRCPGSATSCSTKEIAAQSLLGLLLPVVPAVAFFPLRAMWRGLVTTVRRARGKKSNDQYRESTPQSVRNKESHKKSARLRSKPQR